MTKPVRYDLIDRQTDKVIGSYTKRETAKRRADKLDLAYGAVRYSVRPVWPTPAGWGQVTV